MNTITLSQMSYKMHTPIAVFCFNRPDILQRTLTALADNTGASESHLTVFCDGPRHAEEKELTTATREVARNAQGFASTTIVEREQNMGCAASVMEGLKYMFLKHERLIVIEDDIVTSPHTLEYLNKGLSRYENNPEIFSISSFSYPAHEMPIPHEYPYDMYVAPRFNCWGWASWRNRFENIDWEISDYEAFKASPRLQKAFNIGGADLSPMLHDQMSNTIDSWAIRVDYARFKNNQYNIQPKISYSTNSGSKNGTHSSAFSYEHYNDVSLAKPAEKLRWLDNLTLNPEIQKIYYKASSSEFLSLRHRLICLLRPPLHYLGIWQILKKISASIRR